MSPIKTKSTKRNLPLLQGLLPFQANTIGKEALAGLTLAIIALPECMGYTKISQTPIITGILTMLLPILVFAIFGASRQLVVAADSASAAILAQGILPLAAAGSTQYMAYVVILSFMVGLILIIARILRFGFLSKFLSPTLLVGFLTGVGIQVAMSQIGGMFGVSSGTGGQLRKVYNAIVAIPRANMYALGVSVLVLIVILAPFFLGSRMPQIKKIPWGLLAIVAALAIGYFMNFPQRGVATVGMIPGGFPHFSIPALNTINLASIYALLPTALIIVVVIITQSAATAQIYANLNNQKFNANADLLGLGCANLAAGISGAIVVNGSPTKTQIVDEQGGKTQLATVIAAAVTLLVLLFLTRPLSFLPDAALAALVFTIGIKLVNVKGMVQIFKRNKREFLIALATAAIVVIWGPAQGIIFGMALAFIFHVRRSFKPNNSLMLPTKQDDGRLDWTWQPIDSDITAASDKTPGLMIYHFAASIYYANVDVFVEEVTGLAGIDPNLKCIAFDFMAVSDVDYAGGQELLDLCRRLKSEGVQVGLVRVAPHVMDQLKEYGIVDLVGPDNIYKKYRNVINKYSPNLPKKSTE